MNAKRWALVALGVGLVSWGLDAYVKTKALGYGRPIQHDGDRPEPTPPTYPGRVPPIDNHAYGLWQPKPPPDRSWANTDPPTPTRPSPFPTGQGLGVCQQCGNLPDTPGHELGCPTGRAQYGQGWADVEVPVEGSWEDLLAFMRGRAHYAAGLPDLTKLRPEDFTP